MAQKIYILTDGERGMDDTALATLVDQLDAEQATDQAELERLQALLAPVKARLEERSQRLMSLEREQERREAEVLANAAAGNARSKLERDVRLMLADRSQLAQGLASVLQTLLNDSWWGKKLGAIVDATEDDDGYKLIVFSGRLYAHVSISSDSYQLDVSSSDQPTIALMQQIYAASEEQLRNTYSNRIGFEVKPGVGARIMAVVGNSAGWGSAFKPFESNPALIAQMASGVIDLLNNGTIKVGNNEVSRQTAGSSDNYML